MASDDVIGATADPAQLPSGQGHTEDNLRITSDPEVAPALAPPTAAAEPSIPLPEVTTSAPESDARATPPSAAASFSSSALDPTAGFSHTRWRIVAAYLTPDDSAESRPAEGVEAVEAEGADEAGSVTPPSPQAMAAPPAASAASDILPSEQTADGAPPSPAPDVAAPEPAPEAVVSALAPEAAEDAPSAILDAEGADQADDAAAPAIELAPPAAATQATPAADQPAPDANYTAVDAGQADHAPDRAIAISDRPTTPMLPELLDIDQPQPAITDRVESLSKGIEELVEALDPIGATTSLPDELLRGAIPDAPDVTVRAWLRSLLYLGRVVAPAYREALRAEDMRRARPLAQELAQAAPAVAGAVRASIMLAGFLVGPAGEGAAPSAAPMLRRALASDRVARCLAHLLNDLTALETWLGTPNLGAGARLWVSPGWPASQSTWPARATPSPSALIPHAVSRLPATAGLPPLPPEWPLRPGSSLTSPMPWHSSSQHPSGRAVPRQRQLPAPTAWPSAPPAIVPPETDSSDPADWSRYASGERRILGAIIAITLLFLLPGVFLLLRPNLSAQTQAVSGASPTAAVAASASPTAVASPTATATPVPTATPTPKQPTPRPTSPAVVPTVSALTLVCGSPSVPLPLHNPGATPQSWTLTLPSGVASDGLRGVVNPGKTFTIDLWARSGTRSGTATAYLVSAGHQTPISLTLPGC